MSDLPPFSARRAAREARAARAREARSRRCEAWEALFPTTALAAAGALSSLAFLFQPSLGLKLLLFAFFMAAALISGKRVSLLATLLVSAGIVAVNLLIPVGRVLGRVGPFVLTESALVDGIEKAITFEGLLYASKASIRSSLRIPGRFGALIGAAFVYYDRIIEYKGRIKPASFLSDADELMLKVWEGGAATSVPSPAGGRKRGLGILALALLFAYACLGLGILSR